MIDHLSVVCDRESDLKRKLGGLGDSDRESGSAAKTGRPTKQ